MIGARIYHLITDWRPMSEWIKIWEGGLGIPGGLIGGIGVGYLVARRRLRGTDHDMANILDAAIPGIPVAQAIGRLGNWFNQEIFSSADRATCHGRSRSTRPTGPSSTPPNPPFTPPFSTRRPGTFWSPGC